MSRVRGILRNARADVIYYNRCETQMNFSSVGRRPELMVEGPGEVACLNPDLCLLVLRCIDVRQSLDDGRRRDTPFIRSYRAVRILTSL